MSFFLLSLAWPTLPISVCELWLSDLGPWYFNLCRKICFLNGQGMLYFVKYLMLAMWCMNCIWLCMPLIVIQFDNFETRNSGTSVHCAKSQPIFLIYQHAGPKEEVIFEAASKRCLLSLSVIVQNKVNISIGGLKLTPSRVKNHISLKAKATKPEKWGLSTHSHTKADEGEMTGDDRVCH